MSSYTIIGLVILATYSSVWFVRIIIHCPLIIVLYPKWARFLSLSISVLAVIAAYQLRTSNQALHTSDQALQACSHSFHACENDLQNVTQQYTALKDNHPMKGVPVLRAELSKCQMEKSMLGWFDDAWRMYAEEHGDGGDDVWRGEMIDTMIEQMKNSILSVEKKRRDQKGQEEAEKHEEK